MTDTATAPHILPPPGAFLRPIGIHRFRYAMRVLRVFDACNSEPPGIEYERWGISADGMPIDDGNVSRGFFIDLIPSLIRGVYRSAYRYPDPGDGDVISYRWARPEVHRWPTYYRLIGCDGRGQMDMFLSAYPRPEDEK